MLFNSLEFLVFFPIVVIIYFTIEQRFRWLLLLLSSYYFYMTIVPQYGTLLAFSTLVAYSGALLMERDSRRKKFFLGVILLVDFSMLFMLRYFNVWAMSLNQYLLFFGPEDAEFFGIFLPIGITFYVFQSLSYVFDVYRGTIVAQRHLGHFALYVSFFPTLISGPIQRAGDLLPQFLKKHEFEYERVLSGLGLMLWGFFKKAVIADRLGAFVNDVYYYPFNYGGTPLIFATVFFAFQLYCDFSGYTDIAIGAARVLGINLAGNFKAPYFSKSIPEFWRRWHISLASWFKDYMYIPLGGNRVSVPRWYLNLMLVFFAVGLWHGPNTTFLIWGGLNGAYMIFSLILKKPAEGLARGVGLVKFPRLHDAVKILITFCLVCFGWIFFKAQNLTAAGYIAANLFSNLTFNLSEIANIGGIGELGLAISFVSIFLVMLVDFISENESLKEKLPVKSRALVWFIFLILTLVILLFGTRRAVFIYAQY
jgi:D-alanyl-lipoteichoic acid acyltransferase DltB (MBOAT superfamily)